MSPTDEDLAVLGHNAITAVTAFYGASLARSEAMSAQRAKAVETLTAVLNKQGKQITDMENAERERLASKKF